MYTPRVRRGKTVGGGRERMAMGMAVVRATNASDPFLLSWTKDAANPINYTSGAINSPYDTPGQVWKVCTPFYILYQHLNLFTAQENDLDCTRFKLSMADVNVTHCAERRPLELSEHGGAVHHNRSQSPHLGCCSGPVAERGIRR